MFDFEDVGMGLPEGGPQGAIGQRRIFAQLAQHPAKTPIRRGVLRSCPHFGRNVECGRCAPSLGAQLAGGDGPVTKAKSILIDKASLVVPDDDRPRGTCILAGLFAFAEAALGRAHAGFGHSNGVCGAAISRIRGTGPGVSFGRLVSELERDHPVELKSPFENSKYVAGGVWDGRQILGEYCDAALLKLRFGQGAVNLPLHSHEHSARFIVVLEGRGFFHVSPESIDRFTGRDVRNVPVRSRDALLFTRGVVHTFSAPDESLTLLSYHAPYVPLEDDGQYTIPAMKLLPRDLLARAADSQVACDPVWNVLAHCGGY